MAKKTPPKSPENKTEDNKTQNPLNEIGDHMEKFAVKTAESIRKVIEKALASRNTVLTIRINDDSNRRLNILVDAGLFKSRSESAAFLIDEGIKRQKSLFAKVESKCREIEDLKKEIKSLATDEFKSSRS